MIRAVVDTNVMVSAVISEHGVPRRILLAWQNEKFSMLTSARIIAEVSRVLRHPRIRETYHLTEDDIERVQQMLETDAVVLADLYEINRSPDPEDDVFLACAVEGQADYLVSGDDDLLQLKFYQGVQVVSPAVFSAILERLGAD
jgi:hypothetical protein